MNLQEARPQRILTCSRCGEPFVRGNEFSLLGYRQCLPCDFKMFDAKGCGDPWPEPDKEQEKVTA